jgi:nitric oxide reductase large subunit
MPAYGSIPYLIGLTDFLFFAIFFQAAVRYELGALRNAFLLGSAFIIAVISALYTATGLPVLPFMAIFFVVGNFSRLQWKKEELKQVAVFVIVILILFAFISYKLH